MRIQETKIMRIHADADPQHCSEHALNKESDALLAFVKWEDVVGHSFVDSSISRLGRRQLLGPGHSGGGAALSREYCYL
jgi:hypothetical protein